MRMEGSLSQWNDERGFGFIAPREGGPELFVHISAFPRDGRRPATGERLWFEVEVDARGRKRAVKLARSGDTLPTVPRRQARSAPRPRGLRRVVLLLAAACAIYFAFSAFRHEAGPALEVSPLRSAPATPAQAPADAFHCDGRTRCSEMTSCEEARFFLRHCPGVEMDGNGDGEPCERQWCTSPFAR